MDVTTQRLREWLSLLLSCSLLPWPNQLRVWRRVPFYPGATVSLPSSPFLRSLVQGPSPGRTPKLCAGRRVPVGQWESHVFGIGHS